MAEILRPQTRSEKQNNLVAEDFFEIFFDHFTFTLGPTIFGDRRGMRLAKSQTHTSCLIFKS